MLEYTFLILLFFVLWWFLVKSFDWIDGRCKTEPNMIVLAPYLDKPNYGIFYNPFIEDTRVFYLGQRVYCNGKKFSIFECEVIHYVDIRITKLTLIPENTTDETKYYNLESDGFVTDSRCVKEIFKVD